MEIEKKYLLRALPVGVGEGVEIRQGYLATGDPEVRIRSMGGQYFVTSKKGSGFVRPEDEEEVSKKAFNILWLATTNTRVEKTRFKISGNDGLVWEVDEYHGVLKGFFTAEVELPNCDVQAEMPTAIAAVLVRDVTEEKAYKNKVLAVKGLPV